MNQKIRIAMISFVCLSLLAGLSACQLRRRGVLINPTTQGPAEVQQSSPTGMVEPTTTPVRPVEAPTQAAVSSATAGPTQPAAPTTAMAAASPTVDGTAQAISNSLDQLNQMNQSGDSFNDLP